MYRNLKVSLYMDYTYCSGPSPAESPLKQLLKGHVIIEMSESTLQSSFGCETYAPLLSSNWDSMTYLSDVQWVCKFKNTITINLTKDSDSARLTIRVS